MRNSNSADEPAPQAKKVDQKLKVRSNLPSKSPIRLAGNSSKKAQVDALAKKEASLASAIQTMIGFSPKVNDPKIIADLSGQPTLLGGRKGDK